MTTHIISQRNKNFTLQIHTLVSQCAYHIVIAYMKNSVHSKLEAALEGKTMM